MGFPIFLIVGIVVVLIIVLFVLYFIMQYNRFQRLKNGIDAEFNQIRVALKKRLDLINSLVESVKSYASFEKETLEKITEMRSNVMKLNNARDVEKVERESRQILGNILVAVENYPNLKTSDVVKNLMENLSQVEEEIARQRYTYNNLVQEFNTMIDTFPSNIVARFMGLTKRDYLQFEENVEERPNVEWKV